MSSPLRPASPASPATLRDESHNFRLSVPSTTTADDAGILHHLASMVNESFTKDEGDLWDPEKPEFRRTSVADIRQYIQAGEMVLVWSGGDPAPSTQPSSCVGCARLHWVSPEKGDIEMLVCNESLRGLGAGRALMQFGEDWFKSRRATAVQVELLVPDNWTHPSKARLAKWYSRLGYTVVRAEDLVSAVLQPLWFSILIPAVEMRFANQYQSVRYPRLAPLLAGPSKLQIWEKRFATA